MAIHGLLILDKPSGLSSRAALNRALGWFPRGTKIGHAGTLDPLATGVLVVGLGAATRLLEYVQRQEKVYRAGIQFGARSDTDDAEGDITVDPAAVGPTNERLAIEMGQFLGTIEQAPPAHSAAKVGGRRAYVLARAGREIELAPRKIQIHALDVLGYNYPRLDLEVRCGKGTYIRSLARDLGEALGCGGYLASLRRTRIGPFRVEDAVSLDSTKADINARLLPPETAVSDLPGICLTTAQTRQLWQGRAVPLHELRAPSNGGEAALFTESRSFIGVGRIDPVQATMFPEKMLFDNPLVSS